MVKESVVIAGIDMNVCVTSIQVTSSGNYKSGAPSPGERLAPQERNEMIEDREVLALFKRLSRYFSEEELNTEEGKKTMAAMLDYHLVNKTERNENE